jgi:hypothetical protein
MLYAPPVDRINAESLEIFKGQVTLFIPKWGLVYFDKMPSKCAKTKTTSYVIRTHV